MRVSGPLVVVLVLVVGSTAAVASVPTLTAPGSTVPIEFTTVGDSPREVLGRESGYWYNDSIAFDTTDGVNESELDALVARTMARVERLRRLEFEGSVPVEVISRATYRERQRNRSTSRSLRRFDNAKFEALFLVNESTDSIAVQRRNGANSTLGYYDPDRERVVLVTGPERGVRIDERTLAHELVHTLQDQHFGLGRFDAQTRDRRNAQDALIEGDARLVEYRYRGRCGEEWSCATARRSPGEIANYGVYLLKYFPYSDGPSFVRTVYREGGWPAVNALYRAPPASSEQVIHPGKYGVDSPTELSGVSVVPTPPTRETPTLANGTASPRKPSNESISTRTPTSEPTSTRTSPKGTRPTPVNATESVATNETVDLDSTTGDRTNATDTAIPNATGKTAGRTTGETNSTRNASASPTATRSNASTATATPESTPTREPTPPPTPTGEAFTPTSTTSPPPTVTPGGTWQRVRPPRRPDHATLGEAAIAVMFFYPTYHSGGDEAIVPAKSFFNFEGEELSSFDPYDYAQAYSAGWDGDRLQVYVNRANETGYVWRIAWDSPGDAREFAAGYRRLLAYWGGQRVGPHVFRITDGGFTDAFYVEVRGDVVTIVNAPGIDGLSTLYGINVVRRSPWRSLTVGSQGERSRPISTVQPGFGYIPALVAILLATAILARRD